MQRGGGDADPGCMVTVVAKDDAKLQLQNRDADLRKDDLRKKDSAARSRSPRREGPLGRAETPLEFRRKHAALALAHAQAALALAGWTADHVAKWQWKVREMDREALSDAGGAMTEERQPNQGPQTPDEQEDQWPWVN